MLYKKRIWHCNNCGKATNDPNVEVNLRVIFNCVGVRQLVEVKLHIDTISKLLPIKNIRNAFIMDEADLNKDTVFISAVCFKRKL